MADQEIRIRISADGAPQAGAAFEKAAGQLGKIAPAARSTSQAMGQVSAQLTDIGTSLAGGQNPLLVLIQQGGQLKDMFGGIAPAARAVGSTLAAMLTPLTLVGGAAGLLAVGFSQGMAESNRLRDSLALTGNAAGQTADGIEGLARRTAEAGNITIGAAREITVGLVATGQVGGSALGTVATAAARLAQVTGQTEAEVVRDFASMGDGVADWAAKHNKAWHFVNAEQLDYIRQLEEAGDAQGAMIAAGQALIDHLGQQEAKLGLLERGWNGAKQAASGFWDILKGIGREDTALDKLVAAQAALGRAQRAQGSPLLEFFSGSVADAQAGVQTANRDLLRGYDAALAQGQSAEEAAKRIKLSDQLRTITGRLSGETSRYQRELSALVEMEKAGVITEERRLELTRQLAVEEAKRQPKGPKGKDPEEAYREMVRDTVRNRAPRLADIEAEGYAAASAAAEKNMADAVERRRRFNDQAEDLAQQLADETAQINVSMISDDRERGLAQIELERQTLQARLDALKAGGADITAAQEALNRNILEKQKALSASMRTEWDRLADYGEDAFSQLVSTGRVDLADMVRSFAAESARDMWRNNVTPLFRNGGAGIKGLFSSGSGSAGDSAADDWEREFGEMIGITSRQNEAATAATRATSLFGQGLEQMLGPLGTAADAVIRFIASMAAGSGSGGGGLSSLFGALGSLFGGGMTVDPNGAGLTTGGKGLADYGLGGGRATGGPVRSGFDYWVGENGPERLRMFKGGGGFVTPSGMGGRPASAPSYTVHNHFAPGVTPAMFTAALDMQEKRLRAQTVNDASRRGGALWVAARNRTT